MDIKYKRMGWGGAESSETEPFAAFVYRELLYQEKHLGGEEKIRLEDQPKVVCEAIGRLLERLVEKNVLDLEDFKYVVDLRWGMKADSLSFKPDE